MRHHGSQPHTDRKYQQCSSNASLSGFAPKGGVLGDWISSRSAFMKPGTSPALPTNWQPSAPSKKQLQREVFSWELIRIFDTMM
mmetsp:Transcript_8811/g.19619  ORF Transcript_8811/g.19619 Transcript_8811/m.19619 type:complete len:84 (-) Transcript_8811:647-898(-)